jgi:hypothetical protein
MGSGGAQGEKGEKLMDESKLAVRAGWAAATMAADKFNRLEILMAGHATAVPVEQFLDAEAGSRHDRALLFLDVKTIAERAYDDLRHDDDAPRDVLDALTLLKDYEFRV